MAGIDVDSRRQHVFVSQTLEGSGTLTKRGAGSLVLGSVNNHGGTVVAGGVLSVLDDTRLGAARRTLGLAGGTLRFTTTGSSTVTRGHDAHRRKHHRRARRQVASSRCRSRSAAPDRLTKAGRWQRSSLVPPTPTPAQPRSRQVRCALPIRWHCRTATVDARRWSARSQQPGGLARRPARARGNVDLRGTVLTLGGSNQDSTFAGNIVSSSGVASVEKVGTGTINLTGNNTYSGGTVLRNGALGITTDANIGGSASAITFNGGLLRINGTTLTSMGSHVVNWSNFNGGFDVDSSSNTFTVSQAIGGSGSVTMRGAGRLVLSSSTNSYTGGTRLEGGSLEISSLSNIGGSTAAITFAGGILRTSGTAITSLATNNVNWSTFDGGFDISSSGSTLTLSQAIDGTGSMTKLGSGTLRMNVANTYTGDTNLNAGTLTVAHQDALAADESRARRRNARHRRRPTS